jgi:hypothetical protein
MTARAETLPHRGGAEGQVVGLLTGFATGSHRLEASHMSWLDAHVVPLIRDGGSMTVEGWASPLGSEESNRQLAERRAREVVRYVRERAGRDFLSVQAVGAGEIPAREYGHLGERSNEAFYRAAVVSAWPSRTPPPLNRPAAQLVQRVVSRRFVSADVPAAVQDDVAEFISFLVDQLYTRLTGRSDDPEGRERRDSRRFQLTNAQHRVNRIDIHSTVTFRNVATGLMTDTVTDVSYHWGPPAANVTVNEETTVDAIRIGMRRQPDTHRVRTVPRAEANRSSFYNPVLLRP